MHITPRIFIVNLIQVIVALLANLALFLNMTRRLRFSIALPITIVGWYASAICLCIITSLAHIYIKPTMPQDHVWSEAFWYGIWAAVLYCIDATLLVFTAYGAYARHYSRDFQLTASQRTLMLQTIMFLLYLLLGALVFSKIEGWPYLDGVYWANITLFTIGFGDLVLNTHLARGLLIPYAFVGIVSVALVISSIRTLVLERGSRRVDARVTEKKRLKVLRRLTRRGLDDVLHPVRATVSPDPQPSPGGPSPCRHHVADLNEAARKAEFARREAEFKLMQMIRREARARRRWISLAFSLVPGLTLWLAGAAAFQQFEQPYQNWSYFDGFYFTFMSLTTLGYGDHTPVSNGGRSFFVFWALLALPTMTVLISNASDTVIKFIRIATLELGKKTILPGEHGFERDFEYILYKLSFHRLFRHKFNIRHHASNSEGFMGHLARFRDKYSVGGSQIDVGECLHCSDDLNANANANANDDAGGRSVGSVRSGRSGSDTNSLRRPATPTPATASRPNLLRRRTNSSSALSDFTIPPRDPADYHYRLISAIAEVANDVKTDQAKHYTFRKWVEYLTLIGEDEACAELHCAPSLEFAPGWGREGLKMWERKVERDARRRRRQRARDTKDGKDREKEEHDRLDEEGDEDEDLEDTEGEDPDRWSWVGNHSPLMKGVSEGEWILERLMAKLKLELETARHRKRKRRQHRAHIVPPVRRRAPPRAEGWHGA